MGESVLWDFEKSFSKIFAFLTEGKMDGIVELIVNKFGGIISKEIIVFVISMIPILELR